MAVCPVGGAMLHYDDVGRGVPILFLQGVGVSRVAWRSQLDALSDGWRCLAPDHRGIGGSEGPVDDLSVEVMARDAIAFLDAMGRGPVHVVGHSLGGVVAHALALRAPQRVRSLTLACTFAGGRDLARPSARLIWLGLLTTVGTERSRARAFARLVSAEADLRARGVAAVTKELEAAFGRSLGAPPAIADRQLAALRRHDERARLATLSAIPTLVVSGSEDPIAPARVGRALAEAIPGARYAEVTDASHALPIHQAPAFNAMLRQHLRMAEGMDLGTKAS